MSVTIDLSGKTALITGASGELGRVMARTLASCGANIAAHYFNGEERARRLVDELSALPIRAAAFGADVTRADSMASLRDDIERDLGVSPDIVVTNAVAQYKWTSILEQDLSDYDSQYRSCVLQNVLAAKTFAPAMMKRGWGRIIGISTECAMLCQPTTSAYVSGKGGMDRLLRVLAKEIGPSGVTVNQVAPGWTITENRPARDEGAERKYAATIPLAHRGHDQDIANAVAFLASDLARFITGAFVPVAGGNIMPCI